MMVLAAGVTISTVASVTTLILFVGVVVGAIVTYFIRRRHESGTVETSEAASLWQQTQAMLSNSQEARINAEHQRDALLESQSSIVGPALTNMNDALRQMSTMLTAILDNQQKEGKV